MTTLATQSSVDSRIHAVCDIMRRSNCASALQYIPELTWILFLRILDEREALEAEESDMLGVPFSSSLDAPFRWRDWADPEGGKRAELRTGALGGVFAFVNGELIPRLRGLKDAPNATPRQKTISQVMQAVDGVRIDTERNFLDVLDKVHEIRLELIDPTHMFPLSQAYEGLLLRMGEKNNDGGQFFTPREVIRAMVKTVNPTLGETVYDPACGTGGFLAQAHEHMKAALGERASAADLETLSEDTFYGREKENLIYPIALANLVLHGIDHPNIWRGNTLSRLQTYGGLFQGAPDLFDVILMNPPFGGKEGADVQTRYAYKTSSTQALFLQEAIDSLEPNGRAGVVVDEGLLFRTNEKAFVQTKRKLLDECDLYCVVSLAPGVFTQAGAGVKSNLLFFEKGKRTERIWYYELYPPPWRDRRTGKMRPGTRFTKNYPLTLGAFDEFFQLLPKREDSERSWTVERSEIEARNYDLKAVNPNRAAESDTRTAGEIVSLIEAKSGELSAALAELKRLMAG